MARHKSSDSSTNSFPGPKTVILSLDESPLAAAAIRWTIQTIVRQDDHFIIVSCGNPPIPPGRSADNFAALRKEEAAKLQQRLSLIAEAVRSEFKNLEFRLSFDIEHWKLNQLEHTIDLVSKIQPQKVVLFLNQEEQPWLTRVMAGDGAQVIAKRCTSCRPTILTKDLLMRLDDRDIFGDF
ncbi:hypothetical protein HDV03_005210 [Kappamyces sp. JEL0829]|nr:hypothetical protein HDV03_005210 [Kappamyces sp. JEL0829]